MNKIASLVVGFAVLCYASASNARSEELAIGHTQTEISYTNSTVSAPGTVDLTYDGFSFHLQGSYPSQLTVDFNMGYGSNEDVTLRTWLFGSLGIGYYYELPLLVPVDIVANAKYRYDNFDDGTATATSGTATEYHVGAQVKPFSFLLLEVTVDKVGIIDADYSGMTVAATLGDGGGLKLSGQSLKDGDNALDIYMISYATYF